MKQSKYNSCRYPSCQGSVTRNPEIGLCNRHCDLLEFFLWAMNVVKMSEEQQPEQKDSTIRIK